MRYYVNVAYKDRLAYFVGQYFCILLYIVQGNKCMSYRPTNFLHWRLTYCIVSTSGQSCACVSKESCRLELHSTRFRPFFQSESRIALVQFPGFSGLKIAYCIIMCSQNRHILRRIYQNICCTDAAVNHLFRNYSCLSHYIYNALLTFLTLLQHRPIARAYNI